MSFNVDWKLDRFDCTQFDPIKKPSSSRLCVVLSAKKRLVNLNSITNFFESSERIITATINLGYLFWLRERLIVWTEMILITNRKIVQTNPNENDLRTVTMTAVNPTILTIIFFSTHHCEKKRLKRFSFHRKCVFCTFTHLFWSR